MEWLRKIVRESLSPRAVTFTKDQLRDIAIAEYEKGSTRFNERDRGGVFKYFFNSDINGYHDAETYFPSVMIGDEVVGIAKLQKNPYNKDSSWISYVSIDPKYQGMGYAAPLVDELFRFAKSKNWEVQGSRRSEMGKQRLAHLIDRYSKAHDVVYVPSEHNW